MAFLPRSKELKILVVVAVAAIFVGLVVGMRFGSEETSAPVDVRSTVEWRIEPQGAEGGRDRIVEERYKFSAAAPSGWRAEVREQSVAVVRDDFPECAISVSIGANEGYLSAAGYTELLNPPGRKPDTELFRYAGVTEINMWPAAVGTVRDQLQGDQKEVNLPRGHDLFIVKMRVPPGYVSDVEYEPHPRYQLCEDALQELLESFQIT